MTEDEARNKWCPFVRLSEDWGDNRPSSMNDSDTFLRCIASDCMAWRRVTNTFVARRQYDAVARGEAPQEEGYCGLAGGK